MGLSFIILPPKTHPLTLSPSVTLSLSLSLSLSLFLQVALHLAHHGISIDQAIHTGLVNGMNVNEIRFVAQVASSEAARIKGGGGGGPGGGAGNPNVNNPMSR